MKHIAYYNVVLFGGFLLQCSVIKILQAVNSDVCGVQCHMRHEHCIKTFYKIYCRIEAVL